MATVCVRHNVANYAAWRQAFDDFSESRRIGGEQSFRILYVDRRPDELFLIFEWDNLDTARAFMSSPELKAAMGRAGVMGPPDFYFLREHGRGTIQNDD